MARKKKIAKHARKASWSHKGTNGQRDKVKSLLQCTWSSLVSAKVASVEGEYDGISEASWTDNAWCCFFDAQQILLRMGWTEARVNEVYENLLQRAYRA
jgi:hypothetical protein